MKTKKENSQTNITDTKETIFSCLVIAFEQKILLMHEYSNISTQGYEQAWRTMSLVT